MTAWLDSTRLPVKPGPPPGRSDLAVAAWNLMGGLDWTALPIVAEILGVDDIEPFIAHLVAIRDWQRADTTGD